jgi:alpha-D-ribose 1-methylphosphonate 5-triphosphate synthase subunit PhnL
MNFCRGFITDPKILFLDEPTLEDVFSELVGHRIDDANGGANA